MLLYLNIIIFCVEVKNRNNFAHQDKIKKTKIKNTRSKTNNNNKKQEGYSWKSKKIIKTKTDSAFEKNEN